MYRATRDVLLPAPVTGSLPRPAWCTERLGTRTLLEAMAGVPAADGRCSLLVRD